MLTLSCSKLPSLPQLLVKSDSLDIRLVRWGKITSSFGDSNQGTVVSKAELQHTDNSAEGVSRSQWVLRLGKNQRYVSWRIDGLAEVKVQRGDLFQQWCVAPYLTLGVLRSTWSGWCSSLRRAAWSGSCLRSSTTRSSNSHLILGQIP